MILQDPSIGEWNTLRVLDMSCTERELRRWLQVMARMYPLMQESEDFADYILPTGGTARIAFKPLPMRAIALVRLPRMEVSVMCSGQASPEDGDTFLKTFLLYTQRGGG